MNDNDIIKALKCCQNGECAKCIPNNSGKSCRDNLIALASDLINRQKAKIEKYEKEDNEKFNKWMLLDERTKKRYAELYEEAKGVVRAEAIKAFAERLLELTFMYEETEIGTASMERAVTEMEINKVLKEMTGCEDVEK